MRKIGHYLLANPVHAMMAALLCALLPLISVPGGFIAAILVGFVTLCRGYKTGLIVLAGVAIPVIGMAIWDKVVVFDLLLLRCILVWIFAGLLRRYGSWRLILELMTVLGLVAVVLFHAVVEDVSSWWSQFLSHYQNFILSTFSGQISEEKIHELIKQLLPFATGLFVGLVLFGVFCQLFIARWCQAALFRPGGFSKEFIEIRMGPLLAIVAAIIFVAQMAGITLAKDLFPVILLPFMISGLSLAHKWAKQKKEIVYLLMVVYIGLVFLPLLMIAILALAGYIDSWYDLRKRFFTPLRT